jgi:hypothetical protein
MSFADINSGRRRSKIFGVMTPKIIKGKKLQERELGASRLGRSKRGGDDPRSSTVLSR